MSHVDTGVLPGTWRLDVGLVQFVGEGCLSQQCRRCNEWCGCLCSLAMQPDAQHVCSAFIESQSLGLTAKDMTGAVAPDMQRCQLARAAATMFGAYICVRHRRPAVRHNTARCSLHKTQLSHRAHSMCSASTWTHHMRCCLCSPASDALLWELHVTERHTFHHACVVHKLTAGPYHRMSTTLLPQPPLYQFMSAPCSCPIVLSTSLLFLCLGPKERHGP
jgi:hypothetical protein